MPKHNTLPISSDGQQKHDAGDNESHDPSINPCDLRSKSANPSKSPTRVRTLVYKGIKRAILPCAALVVAPIPFLCLVASGTFDLSRNKGIGWGTVSQYFFGNGILTWVLSPLNLLFDLICLPHRNPGVYTSGMLPQACQEEIAYLIDHADQSRLSENVIKQLNGEPRGMLMFKWYGRNYRTSIPMPAYEKRFQYIRTIGVSVFNGRQSTSLHFGPLRATLRVLYNINNFKSQDAYIRVGPVLHYWSEERLFVFDDTLQHQSVNNSDDLRVCLFVDVLRPSAAPWLLSFAVACVQVTSSPIRKAFYKNWSFLK